MKHAKIIVIMVSIFLFVFCGETDKRVKEIQTVYQEFQKALQNENPEDMKLWMTNEKAEEIPDKNTGQFFGMIKQMRPKKIKIKKTVITEETASLTLEGDHKGKKVVGTLSMVIEDGYWKIVKEDWEMIIDLSQISSEKVPPSLPQIEQKPFWEQGSDPPGIYTILEGHQGKITSLAFSPDGNYLISASYSDYSLRVWDLKTGREIQNKKSKKRIRDMHLLADRESILTADVKHNITRWDFVNGEIANPVIKIRDAGDTLAIDHQGRFLAATGYQLPVKILNLDTWKLVKILDSNADIRALDFSNDGKLLSGGNGKNNGYYLWSVPEWKGKKYKINKVSPQSSVSAIDFSSNNRWLATGHTDSSIVMIDPHRQRESANYYVRDAATMTLKFSSDNSLLVTGQNNAKIYLWESGSGNKIASLKGHLGSVTALAFSPDGSTLASGGQDRKIIIWKQGAAAPLPTEGKKESGVKNNHHSLPEITEFGGYKNLLQNPSANYSTKSWKVKGDGIIEEDSLANPGFVVRYQGSFIQDVQIPVGKGYVLLIARSQSERINQGMDITGLPYLYGYMINKNNSNKYSYLNQRTMTHPGKEQNQWDTVWGLYQIKPDTGSIRIFLQQASGKSAQTGSAARFDDVGIFLFGSESEGQEFVKQYRMKN